MMNDIKNFVGTLTEEIKYYDNAVAYTKTLEATLWGLEQQAQYPENSSKTDQNELSEEINRSRVKLQSLQKLLKDQELKVLAYIKMFKDRGASSHCGGCGE